MIIDLKTPCLPDNLLDLILPRVNEAWNAALALSCQEISDRGYVDAYGEPAIGLIVSWHYSGDLSEDPEAPLPVERVDIELAPNDQHPEISKMLYMFRTKEGARESLAQSIIARLHLDHVRRLNPGRPLMALEDDEIDALEFDFLSGASTRPVTPEEMLNEALHDLGFEEKRKRDGGESAHELFARKAAQRARREQRASVSSMPSA